MRQGLKLLVLAGSAESRSIASAAQARGALVHALVSEPPKGPNPMPVSCDLIDFGDSAQVTAALLGFDAVLDASHGFDALMSREGAAAAARLGLPVLAYARPKWSAEGHARWRSAGTVRQAIASIKPGARVFSAAGWSSLADCAGFRGARLFLRQTGRHDRAVPYEFVELVFGTAPFTAQTEQALFEKLGIDTLICRNLGGRASRPKLDAATALGLEVILLDPPCLPQGVPVVSDVEAALDWIAAQ